MTRRTLTTAAIAALILVALVAIVIKTRGFRASSHTGRDRDICGAAGARLRVIPRAAKNEEVRREIRLVAAQGRSEYQSRCATCHGSDGRGATPIGSNLIDECQTCVGRRRRN